MGLRSKVGLLLGNSEKSVKKLGKGGLGAREGADPSTIMP